jgi:hypothetical protein
MRDPKNQMFAEACALLKQAEQLHRQFFEPSREAGHAAGCEVNKRTIIVLASLGSAPTTDYWVEITGVYQSGDTLYVAVLDTTQADSVQFQDLKAYAVGSPPIGQSYSLSFDNATAPSEVIVAALLDVDGGGVDTLSTNDILGWYASTGTPTGVSSATSHTGMAELNGV